MRTTGRYQTGDQTHNKKGLWERSNPAFFCVTSQVDERTSLKESLHCFMARTVKYIQKNLP